MKENKEKKQMLKKNDFIELEYTGKIKNTGDIFDTNIKEEAGKLKLDIKTRPLVICLGQNMILPAIDDFLIGKEVGKSYTLELIPEKAFGTRKKELIRTMPLSVFSKHNINPQQGMIFTFDNLLGRISAISGGRIIVDFNNPIAGKEVVYELKIKRKLTDEKEKIKSLMSAFFKKEFDFEISKLQESLILDSSQNSKRILKSKDFDDNQKSDSKKISGIKPKKLIIKAEKEFIPLVEFFKEKFKEILSLDLKVEEKKERSRNVESEK